MKHSLASGWRRYARAWSIAAAAVTASAFAIPAAAQTTVSAQQADLVALHAVPGSTLVHTSADHMAGVPVWDIHVASGTQVWDIKVSSLSGAVLVKRPASEQPSSASVPSNSGSPGVQKGDRDGSDLQDQTKLQDKQSSQDQKTIQDLKDANDRKGDAQDSLDAKDCACGGATVNPGSGVVFNQKLTAVPTPFQPYVTQALQSVGGTVKWVKFCHKSGGNTQMNIKINKATGGTTKVKDIISHSGQLVSRNTTGDS